MSIQSEIERIENNIAATYSNLEDMGADMPETQNSNNLPETVLTVKAVRYDEQSMSEAQKTQARNNIGAASSEEVSAISQDIDDLSEQTITTDIAYKHSDLPDGENTVTMYGDGYFGDLGYVCSGEDFIPRNTFNRTFPWEGISITREGMTYHVTGTTGSKNSSVCFAYEPNNIDIPINKNLIGKKVKIFVIADKNIGNRNVFSFVLYDSEHKQLGKVSQYVGRKQGIEYGEVVIPEGTVYARAQFTSYENQDVDLYFQVYAVLNDDVHSINVNEPTIVNGLSNDLFMFPYEGIVSVKTNITDYIDYKARNAEGDKVTYLTPEAFGAVGDGYIDDSQAISDCIDWASNTGQTIIMCGNYLVTKPIKIKYNNLNIILNNLKYTGTDVAIKISGSNNTLQIQSIISSSDGIVFHSTGSQIEYNRITLNSLTSKRHGIVFVDGNNGISQNTIHFSLIKAGGDGCYGIATLDSETEADAYVTENNFYGGHISNCDWAVYCIHGNSKLYSIQVETNVKGGFYIDGEVTIFQPRNAESVRDGEYPFYKIKLEKGTEIFKIYDCGYNMPLDEFDLSENTDVYLKNNSGQPLREHMSVYEGDIGYPRYGVGDNDRKYYGVYSKKTYFWGSQMIFTPWMDYTKKVTTEEFDTRKLGSADLTVEEAKNFGKLPTKFIVDNVNTTIHLHASYCCFGYSKFEVVQANGFSCKIYNYSGDLVFDGSEYGNGTYRISVQNDSHLAATGDYTHGMLNKTLSMQTWSVEPVLTLDVLQGFNNALGTYITDVASIVGGDA